MSSVSIDFPFTEDLEESGSMGFCASVEGNEYSNTVSYISKEEYIPEKKKYPAFRKIFYEESVNNPAISTSNEEAFSHHDKEQSKYWHSKGNVFDTQDRFIEDKGHSRRGPVKAADYPHFFEKGEKYFGRERKILPYLRAQLYTRPLHRIDEDLRKKAIAPPMIGPQTYDLGDYWDPKSYSAVAAQLRPSPFMVSTTQRDGIGERSSHAKRETQNKHTRPLENIPSTHVQTSNLPSTTSYSRPHTPGGVLRRAVDDPHQLQGRSDYHFVRVQQQDGQSFILPVSNEDGRPISRSAMARNPACAPFSIVETWGRPHSRSKQDGGNLLQVKSFSLHKWPYESEYNNDLSSEREQPLPTSRPKSTGLGSSPQTSTDRLASPKGMRTPKRRQELLISPVGKQRAATPKAISARRPAPNDTRGTPKHYDSPVPTFRSLSYEQMLKERKFVVRENPYQRSPAKVKLCVSDHVAVVPSVRNLESMELAAGNSTDFRHIAAGVVLR